jgi:hypothetical protein
MLSFHLLLGLQIGHSSRSLHANTCIVTYKGLVWLIIMGSGLGDWIYWHFLTITVNYNSSQIELLLNALRLLSDECRMENLWLLKCTNQLPFITSTRPKYKSPCRTINCPLLFCFVVTGMPLLIFIAAETWFPSRCSATGVRSGSIIRLLVSIYWAVASQWIISS